MPLWGSLILREQKNRLEKHIVKPILLNLFYSCDNYMWRIVDAITDINTTGWTKLPILLFCCIFIRIYTAEYLFQSQV